MYRWFVRRQHLVIMLHVTVISGVAQLSLWPNSPKPPLKLIAVAPSLVCLRLDFHRCATDSNQLRALRVNTIIVVNFYFTINSVRRPFSTKTSRWALWYYYSREFLFYHKFCQKTIFHENVPLSIMRRWFNIHIFILHERVHWTVSEKIGKFKIVSALCWKNTGSAVQPSIQHRPGVGTAYDKAEMQSQKGGICLL